MNPPRRPRVEPCSAQPEAGPGHAPWRSRDSARATPVRGWLAGALLALLLAGCASTPAPVPPAEPVMTAAAAVALDEQLLRLEPHRVSDEDVRQVLARGPTPRIVNLHGGIYPVHLVMDSFADFLVAMGYPEHKVRHPGDGRNSHSPYESSLQIAGVVAWYYENEGLMPMMVGHSQGGIQLVKVLYLLDGRGADEVAVWNPLTDRAEPRTEIIDPVTREPRPVVGLKLSYAAVVGSGGAALLLPNQWEMIGRLQAIPDSVAHFTGFALNLDLVAWDLPGVGAGYRPLGHARVRNVRLPADYSHVMVASSAHLARDPAVRDWINAYVPGSKAPPPESDEPLDNLYFAAEVWYELKKHWVLEAQKQVRTRRELQAKASPF